LFNLKKEKKRKRVGCFIYFKGICPSVVYYHIVHGGFPSSEIMKLYFTLLFDLPSPSLSFLKDS